VREYEKKAYWWPNSLCTIAVEDRKDWDKWQLILGGVAGHYRPLNFVVAVEKGQAGTTALG